MNNLAPFTGFGDDPNWSVKFAIEHPGVSLPQWVSETLLPTFDMPSSTGAARRVYQRLGRAPWRVAWRLSFTGRADLARLDALTGTRATLRYVANVTEEFDGATEVITGVRYLVLPETILVALTDRAVAVDGSCDATATFERPYVAPVIPEPQPWPEPPDPDLGG